MKQLQIFFGACDIKEEDKKRQIFLTSFSGETFHLIKILIAPAKVEV